MHYQNSIFNSLVVGEPRQHESLTVFPLLGGVASIKHYFDSDEAMQASGLHITEVSDAGVVPQLCAENMLDKPVLLIDGEELAGARQNRVLNTSVLIAPISKVIVPVSCVEEGRWHAESERMSLSGNIDSLRVRQAKVASVSESLKATGTYGSVQSEVWDIVRDEQALAGSTSSTNALADVYRARSGHLQHYVEAHHPLKEQVGAIFAIDGRWSSVELFAHPSVYARHASKLIRSQAMACPLNPGMHAALTVEGAKAELNRVLLAQAQEFDAVGLGESRRFRTENWHGAMLSCDEQLLHLVAFNDSEGKHPDSSRLRRRSTPVQAPWRRDRRADSRRISLPARIESNHLLVRCARKVLVVDTGSSESLAPERLIRMNQYAFQVPASIAGLDLQGLRRHTGLSIDGLVGMDVLSQFDVALDVMYRRIVLRDSMDRRPRGVPITLENGLPVLTVPCVGRDRRLLFDTGSRLSYLRSNDDDLEPSGERLRDFHPAIGPFLTDLYVGKVVIGNREEDLSFGLLPDALRDSLAALRLDGLLGYELLTRYRILLGMQSGYFELRSPVGWAS